MRRLAFAAAAAASLGTLAPFAGRQRFEARVAAEVEHLLAQPAALAVGPEQLRARIDALPEPVGRYLGFAIRDAAPGIRTARLRHGGTFRTAPESSWFPIEGEQVFTAGTPGFVWHATLRPLPVFWIEARDRLEGGRGHMLVKAFSLFTLADATGPEIDQGASLRWLGEAAWFPYAFVGDAVEWEPIDEHAARAILRQPGLPASAVFEFESDGRLARFHADRYRDAGGGRSVLTPFTGRCTEYREMGPFRVPTSVEATWKLDAGDFTYAHFRIRTIEYN